MYVCVSVRVVEEHVQFALFAQELLRGCLNRREVAEVELEEYGFLARDFPERRDRAL